MDAKNAINMIRFFDHKSQSSGILNEEATSYAESIKAIKLANHKNTKYITCWKTVCLMVDIFKESWLRCRHMALLMSYFMQGSIKRTKFFGSYRVELIILLSGRLTDLQNFDVVMKRLMPHEIACLYVRLGYLNLFNPMKIEGPHFLNISNREERIIAKLLAALSTLEPGENWIDETFQWEVDSDPIPGW
jgi:hypothetical protein